MVCVVPPSPNPRILGSMKYFIYIVCKTHQTLTANVYSWFLQGLVHDYLHGRLQDLVDTALVRVRLLAGFDSLLAKQEQTLLPRFGQYVAFCCQLRNGFHIEGLQLSSTLWNLGDENFCAGKAPGQGRRKLRAE